MKRWLPAGALRVIMMLLVCICWMDAAGFAAGDPEGYTEVRIYFSNPDELRLLQTSGVYPDHGVREKNGLRVVLNQDELDKLRRSGLRFEITIPDVVADYQTRTALSYGELRSLESQMKTLYGIDGFGYGSMGGFYTFSEVVQQLDTMYLLYPNLITAKDTIGISIEGRPIYAVKISSDPNIDDTTKPEVLYTALIHAREPQSMMTLMYFMYYLLENYGSDDEVTYLLDHRQLWFVPVINPDGYVYNQTTNPNGGGMWRKNRKNNGGSYGVDLNRNYGTYEYWNSPNGGSSTSGSSDTYRGTAPFSEPETQAMRDFVNSRRFLNALNYHTYSNLLIYPWAWIDPQLTLDSAYFTHYANEMTSYNGYAPGTASQTVGYFVRGASDDWMYGDVSTGRRKVLAMTPEVGATGFWPTQQEIFPLAEENLQPNLYYAWVAGAYVQIQSVLFDQANYAAGDTGMARIILQNNGIQTAIQVDYEWTSAYPQIELLNPMGSVDFTSFREKDTVELPFVVSVSASSGDAIPTSFSLSTGGVPLMSRTINILIGLPTTVFSDNAEETMMNWTTAGSTNGTWGQTASSSHSPSKSFTDSPGGSYLDNATARLTLVSAMDLQNSASVQLSYWQRYSTESGYDYCVIEVSPDGGSTWKSIDRFSGANTAWHQKTYDLSSHAAGQSQVKIRFTLTSDVFITDDGWYLDDIEIWTYAFPPIVGVGMRGDRPLAFTLGQNHPNPFNPSTVISYQLSVNTKTSLKIYNILGQEIRTLVSGHEAAGLHKVLWDGRDARGQLLSSGVYFYRLTAGGFTQTRKMLMIK
jgi:murein tripeptide amidase MpaA